MPAEMQRKVMLQQKAQAHSSKTASIKLSVSAPKLRSSDITKAYKRVLKTGSCVFES